MVGPKPDVAGKHRLAWMIWAGVPLVLLVTVLTFGPGGGNVGSAVTPVVKRHPLAHVVRITATLEFDGERVQIDGLIDCYAGYTGTPTSSPRMVFKSRRSNVFSMLRGGGMIGFRVSREMCYLNGSEWGSALPEKRAPDEWTPVIEYFDHRDLRLAETGIIYLSETALTDPNGRLKIVEPFRVTIPEHPASPELIARADAEHTTNDLWPNAELNKNSYVSIYAYRRLEWMLRFPEDRWRSPRDTERYRRFKVVRRRPHAPLGALATLLDEFDGTGLVTVPFPGNVEQRDAALVLSSLAPGPFPPATDVFELGVPKPSAPRFGMLISDRLASEWRDNALFTPARFDAFIPFTCVDGVMVPVPETPGLQYWFRERCSHPDHFKGIDFFGQTLAAFDFHLLVDRDTNDLWLIRSQY